MNKTYQIITDKWTAAIVVNEKNEIIETAPINRWMLGKHITYIRNWVMRNRFRFIEIENGE